MSLHKLFKELVDLNDSERETLMESVREAVNVKRMCEQLGIPYTQDLCINYVKNTSSYRCRAISPSNPPCPPPNTALDPETIKMSKVIIGDNLDIIEEAAKQKGLI